MQGMTATMSTTETLYSLDYATDSLCNLPQLGGMVRSLCGTAVTNREPSSTQGGEQFGDHGGLFDSSTAGVPSTAGEPSRVNRACGNTRYIFDFPTAPLIHVPQTGTSGRFDATQKLSQSSNAVREEFQCVSSDGIDDNRTSDWISEDFNFSCKDAINKSLQPANLSNSELSQLLVTTVEESSETCRENVQVNIFDDNSHCQTISQAPELELTEPELVFPVLRGHQEPETEEALNALRCEETLTYEDFMFDSILVDHAPLSAATMRETTLSSNLSEHTTQLQNLPVQMPALNLIPPGIPKKSSQFTARHRKASSRRQKSSRRPGIYFEGSLLCDGSEAGNGSRGGTNQPSRFCHICLRRAERVSLMACGRLRSGLCRKVVCERCFNDFGYDWEASAASGSGWTCTHCRKVYVYPARYGYI